MSESVAHLPFLKKRVAAPPAPKQQNDPLHIDLPKPKPLQRPPTPRKPGDPPPRKPAIAKPGGATAAQARSKAGQPVTAPPKPDPAAEAEAKRLKKLQRLAALGDAAAITPEARAQLQAAQQAAEKARQQEAAAKQRAEQLAARQQQLKQQQQQAAAAGKQHPQQQRGPAGARPPAAGPASKLGSGPGRPGMAAGTSSNSQAQVDPWARFTDKQRAFLKVKQRQQTHQQAMRQGRPPPPPAAEVSVDDYDDMDEYDDDFIDDGPGGFDWRSELRKMTGYDPNRYREERFDDRSMVASAREIEAEERRSARMARAEDEKEEEEERRRADAKAANKRKRPGVFDD